MDFKKDFWVKEKKRGNNVHYFIFLAVVIIVLIIFFRDNGSYDVTGQVVGGNVEGEIEYEEIYMGYGNALVLDDVEVVYQGTDKEFSVLKKERTNPLYSAGGVFFVVKFDLINNNDQGALFEKPVMWIVTEEDRFATRDDTEDGLINGMRNEEYLGPGETLKRIRVFDVDPGVREHMIMVEYENKRYYLETR